MHTFLLGGGGEGYIFIFHDSFICTEGENKQNNNMDECAAAALQHTEAPKTED